MARKKKTRRTDKIHAAAYRGKYKSSFRKGFRAGRKKGKADAARFLQSLQQ